MPLQGQDRNPLKALGREVPKPRRHDLGSVPLYNAIAAYQPNVHKERRVPEDVTRSRSELAKPIAIHFACACAQPRPGLHRSAGRALAHSRRDG